MLKSFFYWAAALTMVTGFAGPAAADDPFAMIEGLLGESRLIVISQPNMNDTRGRAQGAALEDAEAGMKERRLIRVILLGENVALYSQDGDSFKLSVLMGEAGTWRRRFDIPQNRFTVALIGLDGGVKKTWFSPVSSERLFAVIDAMPMRQEEIRRKDSERDAQRQEYEGR